MNGNVDAIIGSREWMKECRPRLSRLQMEAEGGCGVVGLAASVGLPGKHILEPLVQMHNRGNGKGGGIAAVGLDHVQMGVPQDVLRDHYLVQVAYVDPSSRQELEKVIDERYEVHTRYQVEENDDPRVLGALPVRPPQVWRYFCRARRDGLEAFVRERGLESLDARKAEDEYVYQTSFAINHRFYVREGMRAFVMSHGRDMMIMKVVGYAEDVIRFYRLEEFTAHVWIGHQRYPTKGRVWHPGGAHPFMGLDEGLVHNGDFANYHSVSEYLAQKNVVPLFLTDTEVSVLLFDLLNRTYGYPLEYIIEALAPTTERDFHALPEDKRSLYQAIQRAHIHGSPDGPWFFIIARNQFYEDKFQLIGITDTAMLRPQVFALVEGEVQIALIGSEKQAIDSALRSIAMEHGSVPKQADVYWNARGGSHTDGGAFIFDLVRDGGGRRLNVSNKFGAPVRLDLSYDRKEDLQLSSPLVPGGSDALLDAEAPELFDRFLKALPNMDAAGFRHFMEAAVAKARNGEGEMRAVISLLTQMIDRRYPSGRLRRSRITDKAMEAINLVLRTVPKAPQVGGGFTLVDRSNYKEVPACSEGGTLVADCRGFPMEGEEGISFVIREAFAKGWRHVMAIDSHGQRFFGCGLGQDSKGMHIEAYGTPGDYLASGLAGATVEVHGNAQDQLGQIFASGKLVVHGDVGQTFMYGAKGGEAYVMGNAAGRPLINAVGKPRVVINGTCLDYLAESFMAGDPLNGGGFVVLNGMTFDPSGNPVDLPTPYPGSNLFSLASGGAIYVRDPGRMLTNDQLNGGRFGRMTDEDWQTIAPFLEENERLFGVSIKGFLLRTNGREAAPTKVYRKIEPATAKGAPEETLDDDI
jgi:glutamate synthase domain-containing protein 1/glutamate synthase domain-containing protein 3